MERWIGPGGNAPALWVWQFLVLWSHPTVWPFLLGAVLKIKDLIGERGWVFDEEFLEQAKVEVAFKEREEEAFLISCAVEG